MTQSAISFQKLVTVTGGVEFTLEIPRHNCIAVVGDARSGAEALCSTALGLTETISGKSEIDGQDLAKMPRTAALAFRRKLGYLPAGDALMQNLSLAGNVALPLKFGSNFGDREIRGRVKVILAALRISDNAESRPAMVRDETRRRAALARALAFDPEILLLEAPFQGITDRVAGELLDTVLGGEHADGSRRTVFLTAQHLPVSLRTRIQTIYRATKGKLEIER